MKSLPTVPFLQVSKQSSRSWFIKRKPAETWNTLTLFEPNFPLEEIFEKDCTTPITDIDVTLTNTVTTPQDEIHTLLELSYNIDLDQIKGSNLWNDDISQLEMCQVVYLLSADSVSGEMLVMQTNQTIITVSKLDCFIRYSRMFTSLSFQSSSIPKVDVETLIGIQVDNDVGAEGPGRGNGATSFGTYIDGE